MTDITTRDYDHHGPAGPTAFWKVSNEIDDSPSEDFEDADDEGEEVDGEVVGELIVDPDDPQYQHMLEVLGVSALEQR